MANSKYDRGIMNIDANDFSLSGDFHANYIIAIASADTWEVVLSDKHGNIFFAAKSALSNERMASLCMYGQPIDGLVITTWTNITRVVIGTQPN